MDDENVDDGRKEERVKGPSNRPRRATRQELEALRGMTEEQINAWFEKRLEER